MNGVTFGSYHSYNDLDLILSSKKIGGAPVRKYEVEIPGRNGVLDLTEVFGSPNYDNRTLEFNFSSVEPLEDQPAQYALIENLLNGKKLHITLDADPGHYYVGRISVGDWENEKCIGKLKITADCEPFKY